MMTIVVIEITNQVQIVCYSFHVFYKHHTKLYTADCLFLCIPLISCNIKSQAEDCGTIGSEQLYEGMWSWIVLLTEAHLINLCNGLPCV